MSLLLLSLLACTDADGTIAECQCFVSREYGSDDERALVYIYDEDVCMTAGASSGAGNADRQACQSDFEQHNSGYDDLACECDCLYTDDGCYLTSSGGASNDTGWAR
jgi:hypothetical protein